MTREEAIEKLHWFALDNRDKQIIDTAIEALTSQNLTEPNNACEVDLISRADAIKAVHKYFVEAFNNEPHEIDEDGDDVFTDMKSVNALLHHNKYVSKALKALPSADAEWIPCSERLPEDGTTVITFDSTGDIEFGSYENGKWYWLAEACADYWTRNSGVLAWMPLPKPYREDGE